MIVNGCPEGRAATKTVVVVASTMRSGSTLLKALLAEAPDVSNLPEINFQRFGHGSQAAARISRLDERPIVVLKRPAWYHEASTYPRLPALEGLKCIALVRDVYPTVVSLRQMSLGQLAPFAPSGVNHFLVNRYWATVTARLHALTVSLGDQARLVRYEDLIRDPVYVTRELFRFMGSACDTGVDCYRWPKGYRWRWGSDDGGERIKTLCVQPPQPCLYDDPGLRRTIERSAAAKALRQALGYLPGRDGRGPRVG